MTESTDSTAGQPAEPGQGAPADPRAQFHVIRDKMAAGTATAAERQNYAQLNNHLHFGGEAPGAAPPADPMAQHYEPARDPGDYKTFFSHSLAGADPGAVSQLRDFAFALKLPTDSGSTVINRLAKHMEHGAGRLAEVPETDVETLRQIAAESLGGEDKYQAAAKKAEAYVKATLSPAQYRETEGIHKTTAAYDPVVLLKLAALHDARGMKLSDQ